MKNLRQRLLVIRQIRQVKDVLERLYEKYNHHSLIKPDPLQFVYQYRRKADMEIVALLASALAYGRVAQIEKTLTNLFGRMGNSPFEYVQNFNAEQREKLKSFKHRFTTGDALTDLLELLQVVLSRFGSIEELFSQAYSSSDENIIPALSRFCDSLTTSHNGQMTRSLKYLLACPVRGSACKRLNLFLRWMVRDDDVDTGLWKSIDKAKLIVPVDVHMGRLCKILGFYGRKSISLSTALEITDSFRQISPADPVKYDFALSRIGIVENCNGNFRPECQSCELLEYCFQRYCDG
ncbi:MAG: TIGR02757 family protein [Sedimentisphaerales bacterium]|nr:TIGR02757 family protein [Sedimentisphaerales bacterium]